MFFRNAYIFHSHFNFRFRRKEIVVVKERFGEIEDRFFGRFLEFDAGKESGFTNTFGESFERKELRVRAARGMRGEVSDEFVEQAVADDRFVDVGLTCGSEEFGEKRVESGAEPVGGDAEPVEEKLFAGAVVVG